MGTRVRTRRRSTEADRLKRQPAVQPRGARARPHPLSGYRLFNGIADADLARVAVDVKERLYPKGQNLCYVGDSAHSIFVIKSGLVALIEDDDRGNPHAVHLFGPGDVFGAMVGLLGVVYTGSATAIVDADTVVIPDQIFMRLMREFPKLAVNVIRELYTIVCRAEETIKRLTTASVTSRVSALLLKLQPVATTDSKPFVIEPHLSHETIALLLGTTRRTVTRAFTDLVREKVISIKGHRVVILEPQELRRWAEGHH
jgi:CRP-like cAMP-binding protein